jgi:toxin ParE1/3/4
MRVVLRDEAKDDLWDIFSWIAKDNPRAAEDVVARIQRRINRLALDSVSEMGRPGLVAGTRELVESPYLITYQVDKVRGIVVVFSIIHGARNRPG